MRKAFAMSAVLLSQLIPCGGALAEAGDDVLAFDDTVTVDDGSLSQQTGREGLSVGLQLSNTEQATSMEGNALTMNGVTGANSISEGAFNGFSGIGTIIQNSGNQVVIQDNTTVNVMFAR